MSSHQQTAVLDTTASITVVDDDEKPQSALQREIIRDELRFEKYGGDDVEDPPLKTPLGETPPPSYAPNEDPNLVTWDGPNDLENPQNWSRKYKWFITIICSVMTVNV
jgi:DHA1 family multidrug resistance protein-like MFS transporter